MKKVFCILLALLMLPAAALADVLADHWQEAGTEELLAALTDLNNEISARRAAEAQTVENIELNGNGTSIITEIEVIEGPVRVTFSSDKEAKLTLSGGKYDHVYNNNTAGKTIKLLGEEATYSALVETSGAWTLLIEPIAAGQTLPFSGSGDAVSDFFELSTPMIVTVSWDASASTAWSNSLYVYLCHQYSNIPDWQSEPLASEFPIEKKGSMDVILKPTKGRTEYCLSVETSEDVQWTIAPKQ